MRFFTSTLCCLLLALTANSQNLNGYVVLHSGDSIFGNIFLAKHAVQVIDTIDNASSFPYSEVKFAKVAGKEGRLFFGRMLYYNDELEDDYVSKTSADTALIAHPIYTTPKMTLYEAFDAIGKIHYLVSRPQDSSLTLLAVNYVISSSKNMATSPQFDKKRQIEVKYYINQLKQLFNDCKKLTWFYESLTYRSYSFKQIIKAFNKKCK